MKGAGRRRPFLPVPSGLWGRLPTCLGCLKAGWQPAPRKNHRFSALQPHDAELRATIKNHRESAMKLAAGTTVIANGQLIDGTGNPPVRDAALVIQDGKIAYAGPVGGAPPLPPD